MGIAVGSTDGDCGFCGRKTKTPLVRVSGGPGFCCISCFRAYQALHAPPSATKENEKPKRKTAKKGKGKAKKRVKSRKPKRGR